jgi:hypothetical protein
MGGKSKAPPPPDYSGVANASAESARLSFQLGQEQLAWAREQYNLDRELTDGVVDLVYDQAVEQGDNARQDRARYESVYQPLEDELVRDARDFASPERRETEMGRAQANVAQQFEGQRQAAQQALESFGVDPTSTRYQALDIGMRAAQGAAQAAAGNQAGQMVDAQGRALRSEAINVGRGYPGQIATQYGQATAAGNSAVSNQLAATASGANTMGTPQQWQGMGNQALGVWGNTLNMGYQNQMAQFNANRQNSSGIGSALGFGASLLTAPLKGTMLGMLEDGGLIDDELAEATQSRAVDIGMNRTVLPEHSPSGGAKTDDVHAMVNVGEFVMPKQAVEWFGEKFFQNLIAKADKERSGAPGKPQMKMAPVERPTFSTAVPVG